MKREEKAAVIEELVEKFANTNFFYFTDASGLTVAEVNQFRKLCFDRGVEYRVAKNTLIQKALEKLDVDYSSLNDQALKGFTGIMFAPEIGNIPAKIIKDFKRSDKDDRPIFKAASIDSELFLGEDQLNTLSNLKSKVELIGEIITLLQSPAKNVISSLQSGKNILAGIIKTLSEK